MVNEAGGISGGRTIGSGGLCACGEENCATDIYASKSFRAAKFYNFYSSPPHHRPKDEAVDELFLLGWKDYPRVLEVVNEETGEVLVKIPAGGKWGLRIIKEGKENG